MAKKKKSGGYGLLGRAARAMQGRPNRIDNAIDAMYDPKPKRKKKK